MSSNFDGRFAPSPTGPLHLGSLRTALVAWLFARSQGARFLLRIEDLDPERSQQRFERAQIDDLRALGIDWDEQPVRQSERAGRYEDALAALLDAGRLYPCFCTRAEIREAASAPHGALPGGAYPGTCLRLSAGERAAALREGRPYALRVRADGARIVFEDRLLGAAGGRVDDFVVRRSDGVVAYQLAVVVDDAGQRIGEVVRGADLADSTARQILLARLLDLPGSLVRPRPARARTGWRPPREAPRRGDPGRPRRAGRRDRRAARPFARACARPLLRSQRRRTPAGIRARAHPSRGGRARGQVRPAVPVRPAWPGRTDRTGVLRCMYPPAQDAADRDRAGQAAGANNGPESRTRVRGTSMDDPVKAPAKRSFNEAAHKIPYPEARVREGADAEATDGSFLNRDHDGASDVVPHAGRAVLALGALGVVYGDIGTSPLYAEQVTFGFKAATTSRSANVYGVVSLIFWSLMIVVSIKYAGFIMRAHNRGDGGIMALAALCQRHKVRNMVLLVTLGIFGASLFFGDGGTPRLGPSA